MADDLSEVRGVDARFSLLVRCSILPSFLTPCNPDTSDNQADISCLATAGTPWYRLPLTTCSYEGLPLYLKIYSSLSTNRLIAVLTDVRSGVWCEAFTELRAIHVRTRLSQKSSAARGSQSQSQSESQASYSEMKQEEAASNLFDELREFFRYKDGASSLEVNSDQDVREGDGFCVLHRDTSNQHRDKAATFDLISFLSSSSTSIFRPSRSASVSTGCNRHCQVEVASCSTSSFSHSWESPVQ